MKKRVLTLALVLAMCLSLAAPAFADEPKTEPETTASETDDKAPETSEPVEGTDNEDAEAAESTDEDAEPAESTEPSDEDAEPAEPVPQFTDVDEGTWYTEPVAWAVEKKITTGTEPSKFSPEDDCTEGQILTFLYRAIQSAEDPDFVPSAEDMMAALGWAMEEEMVNGSSGPKFACTRATAVYYIWRAFGSPEAEAAEFSDVDADAAYAAAVSWAAEKGIVRGYPDGSFGPGDVCSRAQIVTLLYRAYAAAEEAPAEPAEPAAE